MLDFALENNIPCGGLCPKGRKAEDGKIRKKYPLNETESAEYAVRTELNVLHSEGTLVLFLDVADEGTERCIKTAKQYNKPLMQLDLIEAYETETIKKWIGKHKIQQLNIAGPRESNAPGIYFLTKKLLHQLFDISQK